jgi:WhiB family redox-sensing transcriptional regulator
MAQTLTTFDPKAWRERASCRDLDTAVFFPETEQEVAAAKAVCAGCPVRDACLEFALVTRQDDGVWGGLSEDERRRVRRRRQEAARKAA